MKANENRYGKLEHVRDATGSAKQGERQRPVVFANPVPQRGRGNVMAVYTNERIRVSGNPSGPVHTIRQTITLDEHHLYAAARLGMEVYEDLKLADVQTTTLPFGTFVTPFPVTVNDEFAEKREVKMKRYELQAYNQNVVVTISDRKLSNSTTTATAFYTPDVLSYSATYADHMPMPGRQGSEPNTNYRYGAANGQEKVDEITPGGTHYTAEYWEFDARIERRWNIDPVVKPRESPYACFAGNPVWFLDPYGNDVIIIYENSKGERVTYRYKGILTNNIPDNKFVRNVIDAYHASHLAQAVTGVKFPFVEIVENDKITYVEQPIDGRSSYDGQYLRIFWNPYHAVITDKGFVLSPLTNLQHESGHRLDDVVGEEPGDTKGYGGDAEEYRVMSGTETEVGQALGEVPNGQLSRKRYSVISVIAHSPFSNKINLRSTLNRLNSIYKEFDAEPTMEDETIKVLQQLGYKIRLNEKNKMFEPEEH